MRHELLGVDTRADEEARDGVGDDRGGDDVRPKGVVRQQRRVRERWRACGRLPGGDDGVEVLHGSGVFRTLEIEGWSKVALVVFTGVGLWS